jgi:hypothetical protein
MTDTATLTREDTPTVAELIEMFADDWYDAHGQGD